MCNQAIIKPDERCASLRNSKGKEGILLQSTKAIVRRDLTGRSTMRWGTYLKRYGTLYLLLLVPLAFFIIFRYVPMSYILLAFKKNNILKAPWLLDWAKNGGWEWFIKAFNDKNFIDALKNTIILNLLDLVIGTPMPILMALLLNELAFPKFKRVAQTVLYLPHFLSWVIISSLSLRLLATNDGLVNQIFGTNIAFLGTENNWRATYIVLGVWKECGWNTIIYLAALTGISPELYEAAEVDGASRLRKIWHITLPGIRSTIIILLIMNLGRILGSEFDRPFTLSNPLVEGASKTISIFVYERGIKGNQFALSTAVGSVPVRRLRHLPACLEHAGEEVRRAGHHVRRLRYGDDNYLQRQKSPSGHDQIPKDPRGRLHHCLHHLSDDDDLPAADGQRAGKLPVLQRTPDSQRRVPLAQGLEF